MQCKTCGYRLWNLPARRCPECNTAFRPSEFEFVPGSVRFCCPHCGQSYYGTAANGHLAPFAFECVSCHRPVSMDDMLLLPTEGLEEEQTQPVQMPWFARDVPLWRRWFRTLGMALASPYRLMDALPLGAPAGRAWGFLILTTLLTAVGLTIPIGIFAVLLMRGRIGMPGPGAAAGPIAIGACGWGVSYVVAVAIGFPIWGLLTHGLLRLTGRTYGGLGRTYQALCYGSSGSVASVVPCLGFYVGWIGWLISGALLLKAAQRVHGLRAALATIVPPLLVLAVGITGIVWSATLAASGASRLAGSPIASETALVVQAVRDFAAQHNGAGPAHAAELVAADLLTSTVFVSSFTLTDEQKVPLGGTTLGNLIAAPPGQVQAAVRAAALPTNLVAHRLGDFVFTYHGADLRTCPPGLWLVIGLADPDQNPAVVPLYGTTAGIMTIGLADGTVITAPDRGPGLATALAAQNSLRASIGLAPLPDPATVTHARPAVALPTTLPAEAETP